MAEQKPNEKTSLRADKWLWATRFFKTRSQAAKSCDGGHVKRDGDNIKPSTVLKIGDKLSIPAHEATYHKIVVVQKIIEKRVAPPLASAAYQDLTDQSVIEEAREIARNNRIAKQQGAEGRLTKKRRRDWEKITGRFFE